MYKDYHYLFRCVQELQYLVTGTTIMEIFSQEKDKICFHIPTNENPLKHLIISCNPQLPFIIIRNDFYKAKKNTLNFFTNLLPAKIKGIRIANNDRIINLSTDKSEMIYLIRGGNTNLISIDNDNNVDAFKKMNNIKDTFIAELHSLIFLTKFEDYTLPHGEFSLNYNEIKSQFPFLSKKLFYEIKKRIEPSKPDDDNIKAVSCINEIIYEKIFVGIDNNSEMLFQPETFHRNESDSGKSFTDYNKAIQYYITHKFKYNNFIQTKKFLSSNLEKETAILSSKLNNLKSRIEKGSRENEYYNYGNLLLSNLGSVENNIKMIELTDYKTDSPIKIKLDPKLSAADNANLYFEKAKDEKKNYKISKELYETSKKKFETYINFRDRVLTINSIDELMEIKNLLNFRESIGKKKVEDKISYREYVLDNKYRVFVGRDSKSNDLLTVKYAKQNDYWFHARGLPGSHVVLRVDNPKEGIPKNILNNVASIAAFYSKAKTAKIAPVAYTLRKFVRKNKNMNPGQVLLSKESVLLVKPEIPNNAVEIEE